MNELIRVRATNATGDASFVLPNPLNPASPSPGTLSVLRTDTFSTLQTRLRAITGYGDCTVSGSIAVSGQSGSVHTVTANHATANATIYSNVAVRADMTAAQFQAAVRAKGGNYAGAVVTKTPSVIHVSGTLGEDYDYENDMPIDPPIFPYNGDYTEGTSSMNTNAIAWLKGTQHLLGPLKDGTGPKNYNLYQSDADPGDNLRYYLTNIPNGPWISGTLWLLAQHYGFGEIPEMVSTISATFTITYPSNAGVVPAPAPTGAGWSATAAGGSDGVWNGYFEIEMKGTAGDFNVTDWPTLGGNGWDAFTFRQGAIVLPPAPTLVSLVDVATHRGPRKRATLTLPSVPVGSQRVALALLSRVKDGRETLGSVWYYVNAPLYGASFSCLLTPGVSYTFAAFSMRGPFADYGANEIPYSDVAAFMVNTEADRLVIDA